MSAHQLLRARTATAHAALDERMSRFDLSEPASYTAFLGVHARVLPPIEASLAAEPELPTPRRRAPLLRRDLEDLEAAPIGPVAFDGGCSTAEKFGLAYVLEGSRLGGRVLLGRVAPGLPARFLSAIHEPGEWRAFLATLNERAEAEGSDWLDRVASGADMGFRLYEAAAAESLGEA